MDPLLEKYLYYQQKNKECHDRMLHYKKKIVSLLRSRASPSLVYDVRLDARTRSGILKKDVPTEIWQRYSTTTPYDVLVVKKREKMS